MLWDHHAYAVGLLNLYLLVHIGPMVGALEALSELPEKSCIFSITLRNFRPILSWELRNHSIVPTHYTLWYTCMSKEKEMKIVEECTNITRTFCDLTNRWGSSAEMYFTKLEGFRGSTKLVSCFNWVFPDVHMFLEPPEFEIVGFVEHINVTLRFPPALPTLPDGEGMWSNLLLIIEEESEGIVKQHKLRINQNTTGNFIYTINKLIPNTNYCVSVYFEPKDLQLIKRSPLKCTFLRPGQESAESSESVKIGGLVALFFTASMFISTIVLLKRIGYILLRHEVPKVLDFRNLAAWAFPEPPALEAVAVLEVIHISRKKKVWNYNYDDESDDEAVPQASAGGYTMHKLIVGPVCPAPTCSATLEDTLDDCSDPDAEDSQEPEAESQALMAPGPGPWPEEHTSGAYKGRGAQPEDPFPEEDSSSVESSGDRIFFNVDLNSVFVRVPEDSDDDNDDSEDPPGFCLPEERDDFEAAERETSLLAASGEGAQECLGPEDAPFNKSDTSKSDIDIGGGYMRRIPEC